ncbi:MAG: hypothetical protein V8R75_10220 [Oscillospiraceae bacterium]
MKQIRNCAQMADLGFSPLKMPTGAVAKFSTAISKNQRQPMYPPVAGIGLRESFDLRAVEQAAFSYGVPLY